MLACHAVALAKADEEVRFAAREVFAGGKKHEDALVFWNIDEAGRTFSGSRGRIVPRLSDQDSLRGAGGGKPSQRGFAISAVTRNEGIVQTITQRKKIR